MKAHILYAHPEPSSFSAALKDRAVDVLSSLGWSVEVSDLYADRFDPVAGRHDFIGQADPARFHYQSEQALAHVRGSFAPDIAREQARFSGVDLFVPVFPLWWGGMPAIMKGWFDRVMAFGFAYADGKRYESGYFKGAAAIAGIVTGGTKERFTDGGTYGDIARVLWPVQHCMIEYLGLEAHPPFVAYAAPRVDAAARETYLQNWETCLRDIAQTRTANAKRQTVTI